MWAPGLLTSCYLELGQRLSAYASRLTLCTVCPSVIALNAIVSTQHATIVTNTPFQPQRSAIQPTPVPAIADPKT